MHAGLPECASEQFLTRFWLVSPHPAPTQEEVSTMARIVRIHQYGDADVLKLEELDVPAPAADEVQIEVKAIG